MKYIKIVAMLLLPLIAAACGDDEKYNSGAATVEFETADVTIQELTSTYNCPIVVAGDHSGLIKVTVALKETGDFVEDTDIIITQHDLLIPEGTETVNVEMVLSVSNDEIEPDRSFSLEIVSAEGAEIGANAVCTVNIEENNPLEGTYNFEGYGLLQGSTGVEQIACMLTMVEGSTDQMYMDFGLGGAALVNLEEIVPGTQYRLTFATDQVVGAYGSYGDVQLLHMSVVGQSWNQTTDDFVGTFENKVVTFEGLHAIGLYIPGAGYLGLIGAYNTTEGTVPLRMIKE